jgi:putative toxin-antitoxin system antitoxin component (TIGR02293 family)
MAKAAKTAIAGKERAASRRVTIAASANDRKTNILKMLTYLGTPVADEGRPEYRMTAFEKMELVEEGISKKALENLKAKAGLDYDQLARVLKVARATLINKKGNDKFNSDVSDKILGLADIYSYGFEVFEDRGKLNEWIFRESRALGNQAPFDILHTSFGREEVKNLIGRIEYGIYS